MDLNRLGAVAIESDDLTVDKSFERELPRAGVALVRLKDYIELGRHASRDETHKPSIKVVLVFELSHPDHMIEIDGKKVPTQLMVRTNKGSTSKSGYRRLFNSLNIATGGKAQHFIQLIDKPALAEVYHTKSKDQKTTYANLDLDGAWSFKAPFQVDVFSGTMTPIPVPELSGKPRVFLWENPSVTAEDIVEMWNSIFIEGTREITDEVTKAKKTVSKNWIQEAIVQNLDWQGSTTQALVEDPLDLGVINAPVEPEVTQEVTPQAASLAGLVASASATPTQPEVAF